MAYAATGTTTLAPTNTGSAHIWDAMITIPQNRTTTSASEMYAHNAAFTWVFVEHCLNPSIEPAITTTIISPIPHKEPCTTASPFP